MRYIIDAALLLIFAYCVWLGRSKGLLNIGVKVVAFALAIVLAAIISNKVSPQFQPAFDPFGAGLVSSQSSAAMAELGYTDNSISVADATSVDNETAYNYCNLVFQRAGVCADNSKRMASKALERSRTQGSSLEEAAEDTFCLDMLDLACSVLFTIMFCLLFYVIELLVNREYHLKSNVQLENIGGIVGGCLLGLFICTYVSWILGYLGVLFGDAVEKAVLAGLFLKFNFLTLWIV